MVVERTINLLENLKKIITVDIGHQFRVLIVWKKNLLVGNAAIDPQKHSLSNHHAFLACSSSLAYGGKGNQGLIRWSLMHPINE